MSTQLKQSEHEKRRLEKLNETLKAKLLAVRLILRQREARL